MKLLIFIAVVSESTATFTHHLGLFGRNFTHSTGLFGRNHTHLLQLVGQKFSHKLKWLGHELRDSEVHDKHHLPGWVPNVLNPLVRAAFPEANAYYLEHYISNVTFDGPGNKHGHPLDPSYNIPTVTPPAKRTVPAFHPENNETLSQQVPGPDVAAQNTSASNIPASFLTSDLQSRPAPPEEVLQAVPNSKLTSGQQLQQVSHNLPV